MNKKLILLSGKINSGKNQLAEYIKKYFETYGYNVSLDLFAKDLKDFSSEDFKSLGDMLKTKIDNIKSMVSLYYDAKLDVSKGMMLNRIMDDLDSLTFINDNFYENKTDITRVLLQLYGTNIARNRFSEDFWVTKTAERINNSSSDIVIITDLRFPNEIYDMYKLIKNREVITVRINRHIQTNGLVKLHDSELALDDYNEWFYIIDNNGTKNDLNDSAKVLVDDLI